MENNQNNFIKGVPSMLMLSAKDYIFRVSEEHHLIEIPREGSYYDIDPEFFSQDDGEFNILDNNILYLPAITKVLFATMKYPDLKINQFFAPSHLKFEDDKVIIIGQILEMLIATKDEDGVKEPE